MEKALTDEQIVGISSRCGIDSIEKERVLEFARAIQYFVIQSDKIQSVKKIAEKYSKPQSMELAPRDGTEILGVFSDGSVEMMKWVENAGDDSYTGWSTYDNVTGGSLYEVVFELYEDDGCKLIGWIPVPKPDLKGYMNDKYLKEIADKAVIRMPIDMALSDDLYKIQFYNRANDLLDEVIKLRKENETLSYKLESIVIGNGVE